MGDKQTGDMAESFSKARTPDKPSFDVGASRRISLSLLMSITFFFVGCLLLVVCFAALTSLFPDSMPLKLFWFDTGAVSFSVLLGVMVAVIVMLAVGYYWLKQRLGQQEKSNDLSSTEPALEQTAISHYEQSAENHTSVKSSDVQDAKAILDYDLLLENMDGDQEAVRMLLEIFIDEHNDDASLLSEYLLKGQTEDACRIAHSLKGVASSLEANQLREIAEQLERTIKHEKPVDIEDIGLLDEAIAVLNAEMAVYLKSEALIKASEDEAVVVEEVVDNLSVREACSVEEVTVVCHEPSGDQTDYEQELAPPVLNVDCFLHAMDDDVESARILLEIFINEHADDVSKLAVLVGNSEPENICEHALRLVHSLKGVAGNISADALKQQAEMIEFRYKRRQRVEDVEYKRLEWLLDRTVEEAAQYLSEQSAEMA